MNFTQFLSQKIDDSTGKIILNGIHLAEVVQKHTNNLDDNTKKQIKKYKKIVKHSSIEPMVQHALITKIDDYIYQLENKSHILNQKKTT